MGPRRSRAHGGGRVSARDVGPGPGVAPVAPRAGPGGIVTHSRLSRRLFVVGVAVLSFASSALAADGPRPGSQRLSLDASRLELMRCRAQAADYRGRHALRLMPLVGEERTDTT